MNISLENVNLKSNSGPNYFAQKLVNYLSLRGDTFSENMPYDVKLCFIESHSHRSNIPMVQRLDGIYFNANFDCDRMNSNIKRTYEMSQAVVFQTDFNKDLIFNWFGEHPNYEIIRNGFDKIMLDVFSPDLNIVKKLSNYENVWSCAASWHAFKRLEDNVNYFLQHSGPDDCLVVAGSSPDYIVDDQRVLYMGNLNTTQLLTLYKISKYFLHLAYLDHCPNVVVDAAALGCTVICSSAGGTKEVAGKNAILIQEEQWDFNFLDIKVPPKLDYNKKTNNAYDQSITMTKTAKKYHTLLKETGAMNE